MRHSSERRSDGKKDTTQQAQRREPVQAPAPKKKFGDFLWEVGNMPKPPRPTKR